MAKNECKNEHREEKKFIDELLSVLRKFGHKTDYIENGTIDFCFDGTYRFTAEYVG